MISITFLLFAFYFVACFWSLFTGENEEEAEKKNDPKEKNSRHIEALNSGLKGFQGSFAGSQSHIIFANKSNFSVLYSVNLSFSIPPSTIGIILLVEDSHHVAQPHDTCVNQIKYSC